ncbi:hypothetical protein GYMLUDRAFT_482086 [Collybiopsis luxurians FD-317 M1]|uniref:Arylesterase n=1 Tax=Collybiopsis luxurians FD-317 M1 TaxID=944289 RepID=A0A0D0CUE2_9AGAR|nr:hypothetical protein GYMLUDRAFT_482086 [Collybiopsis luxurians FD-317 M1]
MRRFFTILVPLLGLWIWRGKYLLYYSILTRPDLPDGYYYRGDVSTHCSNLNSSPDPAFKYCEDASFWELHDTDGKLEERRVIVSCDSGRKQWNTVMGPLLNPTPRGSLWTYSPTSGKTTRLTLENYPENHTFHPLGVEIYPSYAGNASYMYVVNHAARKTVIEQFLISPSSSVAKHIRTLSHPLFIAPNALALTSPTSFYVTNDHVFTRRLPFIGSFIPLVETIFGLPLSFAAHVTVDPNEIAEKSVLAHTLAAPFVAFANGVSVSPSGLEVAIASTSTGAIYFYDRNIANNILTFASSVLVPFAPDNINYDHDGNLVVSGHPHFPTLTKLAANKTDVAPSWVVSVSPVLAHTSSEFDPEATLSASAIVPPSNNRTIQTLFQSNGNTLSSGATGLKDTLSGNVYISGLYAEQGVMVCRN